MLTKNANIIQRAGSVQGSLHGSHAHGVNGEGIGIRAGSILNTTESVLLADADGIAEIFFVVEEWVTTVEQRKRKLTLDFANGCHLSQQS